MKKLLVLLLALAMIFAFAACGEEAVDGDQVQDQQTEENGEAGTDETVTFTLGFDAEFPPFGFIDENGEYDGFDLALAAEACNRLGWEFVAQPITWDAKDAELAAGNISCIWNGFTMSEDRIDEYTWSDPYYDNSIIMVVRADSGISSLADLEGKYVITQAGSSALTALEENTELTSTFAELLECADYNSAFMELSNGTVDAIAADVGVANYNMANKEGEFVILDEAVASEVYAVGFLKGNTEMAEQINTMLHEMAEDGTMEQIAQDYVDYGLVMEALCLLD